MAKVRFFVMNFIRVLLVFSLFVSYHNGRNLVFVTSILGLIATFLPLILEKIFDIDLPVFYEIIIIFFIYGLLFLGEVRGFYADFWWWSILLHLLAASALGFIGLTIVHMLEKEEIIDVSQPVLNFLAFCFAFTIGSLWVVFEFLLDSFFGFNLIKGLEDVIQNLIVNAIGAFLVCAVSYIYVKSGKENIFSSLLLRMISKNRSIFRSKSYLERSSQRIKELVEQGEGEKLEFKSSLRTNLHTNELDKRIEHSILKTVVAYLNSKGGILMIGVSDDGKVIGLEKDNFESNDNLKIYFTNLLKSHVGNRFLPFIDFELYSFEDKHVLKVECRESDKAVFLKWQGKEEFYVRNGPSSAELAGSEMLDYVRNKYG